MKTYCPKCYQETFGPHSCDKAGGYCPKCDIVWASPGVCNCDDIFYCNTKEGMHETAKKNNSKAWALGYSCDECNKKFEEALAGANIVGEQDYIIYSYNDEFPMPTFHCAKCGNSTEGFIICLTCNPQKYEISSTINNVYATQIWNEAIEAAAKIVQHSGYYEQIKGLKK